MLPQSVKFLPVDGVVFSFHGDALDVIEQLGLIEKIDGCGAHIVKELEPDCC